MYFEHVGFTSCDSSQFQHFHPPYLPHHIQFLLLNYFWEWGLFWHVVDLPGILTIKENWVPLSCQASNASSTSASDGILCALLSLYWLELAHVLCMLSQPRRGHIYNCLADLEIIVSFMWSIISGSYSLAAFSSLKIPEPWKKCVCPLEDQALPAYYSLHIDSVILFVNCHLLK